MKRSQIVSVLVLIVVIMSAILSMPTQSAQAELAPPPSEQTIFVVARPFDGVPQIFRLNEDGSEVLQITFEADGVDQMFDVSSDGTRVVYTADSQVVVVVDQDGNNRRVLFDSARYVSSVEAQDFTSVPQFNADATQIVFLWNYPSRNISTVNVQTRQTQLVSTYRNAEWPNMAIFSPDGESLAVTHLCGRAGYSLDIITLRNNQSREIEHCSSSYYPVWIEGAGLKTETSFKEAGLLPLSLGQDVVDGHHISALYSENTLLFGGYEAKLEVSSFIVRPRSN
jgi:Tol biopolymer transport system component